MKTGIWMLLIAVAYALAGCGASEDVLATSGIGYVENQAALVDSADWSGAARVDVSLSEYAYAPSVLRLRQDRPYRLHLVNDGTATHYFVSEEFFKAIAVARLVSPGAELTAPHLKSIVIPPGTSKDLYFVAVEEGTYKLECTAPLHALFGMVGTITIE